MLLSDKEGGPAGDDPYENIHFRAQRSHSRSSVSRPRSAMHNLSRRDRDDYMLNESFINDGNNGLDIGLKIS